MENIFLIIAILVIAWGVITIYKANKQNPTIIEFGYEKPKDIGFFNIKVGDEFEGFACGHFFTNQIAKQVSGDYVEGTTNLAIFSKEYIRPIRKNNEAPKFYSIGLSPDEAATIEKQYDK